MPARPITLNGFTLNAACSRKFSNKGRFELLQRIGSYLALQYHGRRGTELRSRWV